METLTQVATNGRVVRYRKINCNCGTIKDTENTSILRNDIGQYHFHTQCKKCQTKKNKQIQWRKKTDDELEEIMKKHYENAEMILEELENRSAKRLSSILMAG